MKLHLLMLGGLLLMTSAFAENWRAQLPTPPSLQQAKRFDLKPYSFQTTFEEEHLGRCAPINTQTAVGLPGEIPIPYGYLMRQRCSEFDMTFTVRGAQAGESHELRPYRLDNFWQTSPCGWLPGCVSDWDHDGIHYRVSLIMAPNKPQPLDLYEIVLKNMTNTQKQAGLILTLNGDPTLQADGDLIQDGERPLLVMKPPVPVKRIARAFGVVDPRTTASAPWEHLAPATDRWIRHRDGYYGMPIEYLLKVKPGQKLQVFLGYGGTPNITSPNWDVPRDKMNPYIRDLLTPPGDRAIIAHVEGDPNSQRLQMERLKHVVQRFIGSDTNGDGYVKISVRATPESRQPAALSWIQAYPSDAKVGEADLFNDPTDLKGPTAEFLPGPGQPGLSSQSANTNGASSLQPIYKIDVGSEFFNSPDQQWSSIGSDPTVYALKLAYQPTLAPGEEKRYELRLPAIDCPEPAAYGNPVHPYDTRESWKPFLRPRHPENKTPYGEDVPQGVAPSVYARYGPKPRTIWHEQLVAARSTSFAQGLDKVDHFWTDYVASRARFLCPEPIVRYLYKHQLAILSLYRLQFYPDPYYVCVGGPFWYWDCSAARDLPYIIQAWEVAGYPGMAESFLDTTLTPRKKLPPSIWTYGQWRGVDRTGVNRDGLWLTRTRQYDGQGQTLWAIADHYFYTRDKDWMERHDTDFKRGADAVIRLREQQKKLLGNPSLPWYGLMMPASGEAGGGGYSFYVNAFGVMGLEKTAEVARLLGDDKDARHFAAEAADFKEVFHRAVAASFARVNPYAGTIPQNVGEGLNRKKGVFTTVFGPPLVWPTGVMAPFDPRMNGWNHYQEWRGSASGDILEWPYIFGDWSISYLRRGEPDRAVDVFYSYINNASGTHDWAEIMGLNSRFGFSPKTAAATHRHQWAVLSGGGESPHDWAAAFYVVMMRNLFLNEQGDSLHLAPGIPRWWLAQSDVPVGVEHAPSYFGPVTYHLHADPDRTTIRGNVNLSPDYKPGRLYIHIRGPGGRGIESATVDGHSWPDYYGDVLIIPKPESNIRFEVRYAEP